MTSCEGVIDHTALLCDFCQWLRSVLSSVLPSGELEKLAVVRVVRKTTSQRVFVH